MRRGLLGQTQRSTFPYAARRSQRCRRMEGNFRARVGRPVNGKVAGRLGRPSVVPDRAPSRMRLFQRVR